MGESQGYAQVTSPFEMIQNPNQARAKTTVKTTSRRREKASPKKEREGKIQAVTRISLEIYYVSIRIYSLGCFGEVREGCGWF